MNRENIKSVSLAAAIGLLCGVPILLIGKLAEREADDQLKKTAEAVASMRRSQEILRTLNPQLLGGHK